MPLEEMAQEDSTRLEHPSSPKFTPRIGACHFGGFRGSSITHSSKFSDATWMQSNSRN